MDQERREVWTPEGRCIVFHLAGPEDGELLFFHTGTPGHPYIYVEMIRECAARGLRIACIARPGYAGSDRLRGRTYAEGPVDTAAVADELGAREFYALGHSGGGGPALADAALLPDRVRSVAASATLAPRPEMGAGWGDGLEPANGPEIAAMEAGEGVLKDSLEQRAGGMREIKTGEQITTDPDFGRFYAPVDRECFTGDYLDFVLRIYALVGSDKVDGWIDDDFAFFGEWGFDLAEVAVPVTIWQGGQDSIIPIAHAEWLAQNVPGAQYRYLPEDGHVSLLNRHFGAMLDDLIVRGS